MRDPILGQNGWECDNKTTAIPVAVRNPSTGGMTFSAAGSALTVKVGRIVIRESAT